MSGKVDELFRRIVREDAKLQSEMLMEREKELNRNPVYRQDRARFEKLLDEKLAKKETFSWKPIFTRAPKRFAVAVAAAVFVIALAILPATSEAVRERITKLIERVTSRHTEYQLVSDEDITIAKNRFAPIYVPEGFALKQDFYSGSTSELYYENGSGQYFGIGISSTGAVLQADTENANVEPITIWGREGRIITKEDYTIIIWSTEERIFDVYGTIDQEELIKIAESIKTK